MFEKTGKSWSKPLNNCPMFIKRLKLSLVLITILGGLCDDVGILWCWFGLLGCWLGRDVLSLETPTCGVGRVYTVCCLVLDSPSCGWLTDILFLVLDRIRVLIVLCLEIRSCCVLSLRFRSPFSIEKLLNTTQKYLYYCFP